MAELSCILFIYKNIWKYFFCPGCALPPDYSLIKNYDDEFYGKETQTTGKL